MATTVTLTNHWADLAKLLAPRAEKLADDTAGNVFDTSQGIVPVDTGELKGSGHVENRGEPATRYVVYETNHCLPVEYGTYKMAAQPYLTPAMERGTDYLDKHMQQLLEPGW